MSALRAYRGLLGNGPLTRLLAGEFVSGIGDWLYLVALLIVVYQHSQDAFLLGIVGAARVLPYVLLSVPAGIAADRFDRRLVLIVTDTARALIMLVIAWLVATNGPIEAIVGLAIFATCFSTFFGPTIGAYLPSLVADERQLGPANSAWASLDNLAFVVGPVLAGVLVAAGGLTVAFVLNAVSFLIVDIVLWRLPPSRGSAQAEPATAQSTGATATAHGPAAGAEASTWAAASTGIAAATSAAAEPDMRLPILVGLGAMDTIGSFVFGGVGVLTVFLAANTYGGGEEATGYLNGTIGVGGLLGAVVSGAFVLRPNLGPTLVVGALAAGGGLALLGTVGDLTLALVALTISAAGSLVLEVVSTTIFQRAVPDRIRGRSLGMILTVSSLAFSAGSFLIPVLADAVGVTPVLVVSGAAVAVGAVGGRILVGSAASRPVSPYDATLARVAALPIFAGVSGARLERALRNVAPLPVEAGAVVIRQGDPADRFFIIERGRFQVTQHDREGGEERTLREMGPDEVFGEIGLLRESPRTATVTALQDGQLLALERADFLELVAAESRLGVRLLDLRRVAPGAEPQPEAARLSAG